MLLVEYKTFYPFTVCRISQYYIKGDSIIAWALAWQLFYSCVSELGSHNQYELRKVLVNDLICDISLNNEAL